ncbi:hypothetical protein ACFLYQ_02120 [Chloroflexota bacterium]
MKRLISAVLLAALLVTAIPGASPALARDTDEEVSTSVESANRTTSQVYTTNDSLMDELDRLVQMLREAENKGDKELMTALMEKIRVLKAEMEKANVQTVTATAAGKTPRVVTGTVKPQTDGEKPTVSATGESQTGVSNASDSCKELEAVEAKKKYYEALNALSDDELTAKGYIRGRGEIQSTIESLDEMIVRLRTECEAGATIRNTDKEGQTQTSNTGSISAVTISAKPVAAGSGDEISDYYKRRITEIATEENDIDRKVATLKELRDEIDRLIEELIKSKNSVSTSEMKGLVERIQVRAGEVRMDEVTVDTTDKKVTARINERDIEIQPTESRVMLKDGNFEVNAQELSIEDEVLSVGNAEVKLMPNAALANINFAPKEMELAEENNKSVYRIKTDENRKLFGFIKMKVENTITVDASNTNGDILKEQRPWWAFLTTGTE